MRGAWIAVGLDLTLSSMSFHIQMWNCGPAAEALPKITTM